MFNWRRPVTPLAACLCVLSARAASAQGGANPYSTSFTITNGLTASQHVDLNASPLTFSGVGYDLGLGMRRGFGRWSFATTFDGAHRSYTTHLTAGTPSTETSFDGRLALSLVRELGGHPGRGLGVGLFVDASAGMIRHQYTDPGLTVSDFVHGVVSVGPEVTWGKAIGDGLARVDVSAPLFGFVHRPYADTRRERPATSFTFATPSALRAINAGVSYETSERRRLGLFAAYRLRAMDLTEPQPFRSLTNTFSLGIVARFGRGNP
jgi:hypothetical protein